ncbi:heme-binding domain-containing protein [Winogradskyella sp. UBA3174]|uniref:heme-binding domain-containing protein n=1 Tax=Winogradskyella sp. UBA3174 TaxID=1947785 RepID=UPI0025EF5DB2|nr:heme-binding domain-containing protein [Winogradskyella sp. UBA3174]|tara:strand:+ start:9263 stop:9742 length:480 start_codon:yes stop_codon:yes gene_type:complete
MMKKLLKKIGLILLVVFIIAQFFGPDRNEGDITSVKAFLVDTNPPEDVKAILEGSCFDCHSDHTTYPWYNNITPVNYWLESHVKDGKKHFNASKWTEYSDKKKDHKLDELAEEVGEKEMPLPSYTWTHDDADLSQAQIDAIVAWVNTTRVKYVFLKEPQ